MPGTSSAHKEAAFFLYLHQVFMQLAQAVQLWQGLELAVQP